MHTQIVLLILGSGIAAFIAEILEPFGRFLNSETYFFKLLFGAIFIDLIIGAAKHWKDREFDSLALLWGLMTKIGVSILGIILFMLLADVPGIKGTDVGDWFLLMGRVMVIFYPAFGAFINMHYVTNKKFPPIGFMLRLKKFNKTLNVKDLEK